MSTASEIISLFESEPIGKKIGSTTWVHKNYDSIFPQSDLKKAKEKLDGFSYTIVKYDKEAGSFSFIYSKDFDSSPEPTVGDSRVVKKDGTVVRVEASKDEPQIYHKKELMVGSDYRGFDVSKAKSRSEKIDKLKVDKTRIGRKSYWQKEVLPKLK